MSWQSLAISALMWAVIIAALFALTGVPDDEMCVLHGVHCSE